jgi:hypothetical protein
MTAHLRMGLTNHIRPNKMRKAAITSFVVTEQSPNAPASPFLPYGLFRGLTPLAILSRSADKHARIGRRRKRRLIIRPRIVEDDCLASRASLCVNHGAQSQRSMLLGIKDDVVAEQTVSRFVTPFN